jgi:hypothetical protein
MASNHLRKVLLIALGLFGHIAYAAELPDLIARLEKLEGQNAVSLSVHIVDQRSRTEEDKDVKPIEKGDFAITAGAKTLTVTVAGKLSDTRVFQEFSVLRAGALAHYAPQLAQDLAGLKLLENRRDTQQGIACRRWRLQSEEKQSKFGVKSTTLRNVELWLDTHGDPVRASFKTTITGRMLLFKFSSESTRNQQFKRIGDRLVLTLDKNKTDTKSKAGAEKRTVTTTVKINES